MRLHRLRCRQEVTCISKQAIAAQIVLSTRSHLHLQASVCRTDCVVDKKSPKQAFAAQIALSTRSHPSKRSQHRSCCRQEELAYKRSRRYHPLPPPLYIHTDSCQNMKPHYGEEQCQQSSCTNRAYYSVPPVVLCGVHARTAKKEGAAALLPKRSAQDRARRQKVKKETAQLTSTQIEAARLENVAKNVGLEGSF